MQGQTTSIGETITTDTAQTISGAKTFTGAFNIKQSNPWLHIINTGITKGTIPTADVNWTIKLEDSSSNVLGQIQKFVYKDVGNSKLRIGSTDYNDANASYLELWSDTANSKAYVTAPYRTYSASNTGDIVTVGMLNTDMSVAGIKTFTGAVTLTGTSYHRQGNEISTIYTNTATARTDTVSAWTRIFQNQYYDKNGDDFGYDQLYKNVASSVQYICRAWGVYAPTSTDNYCSISLSINANNISWATAPYRKSSGKPDFANMGSGEIMTKGCLDSRYTVESDPSTLPTTANTDGGIHIIYCSSEPATKVAGYIYLVQES